MAQSGTKSTQARISGQVIINELLRNMEMGRLELGYSVLVPCIFSVYLHPDDHARLKSVHEIIVEDAKRALNAAIAEWNGGRRLLRRGGKLKTYRIAQKDWSIELFADMESAVPPGDVEIHSELNDAGNPGYRGVKTTLFDREASVTRLRTGRGVDRAQPHTERVFAEIRYEDDSGPQTYFVTQDETSIGRGGADLWVDLPLYTTDEISREHARLRRDATSGAFSITDQSRNGTWLNGRRLRRGVAAALPERAEIGLADAVKLTFEVRHG